MNDDFGDRMKGYENAFTQATLDPRLPIYARLDGRSFSSLTRSLRRPFDERMSISMAEVTMHLVEQTHALIGYTQSDEISLLWMFDEPAQPLFGGKIQKLASVLSGMASAAFTMNLIEEGLSSMAEEYPHFDCRILNLPNKIEATNMLLWRTQDANRNAISMAASAEFSHKQLQDVSTADRLKMLTEKGINFEDYPMFFKWGSFFRRVVRPVEVDETMFANIPEKHRPAIGTMVPRTVTEEVLQPNKFSMVSNREGFIFRGEEPYVGWNGV